MKSIRKIIYNQLEPAACNKPGLSFINRAIVFSIIVSSIIAILETEVLFREKFGSILFYIECFFISIFTIEYIARMYAVGEEERYRCFWGRLRYAISKWSIIDLLAIIPFFLSLGANNLVLIRALRILRIMRLARLGRFTESWEQLSQAFYKRRFELCFSALLAFLLLLFSSTALYLVEGGHQPEQFGSIIRSFWWSIATLTTVGYGDVTPITPIGRILAGITALAGIGLIAMPTGILAAAFSDAFQDFKKRS